MPSASLNRGVARAASSALLMATILLSLVLASPRALAADLPIPPGDLTKDDVTNVVDVQCGIIIALWELAGSQPPQPVCLNVSLVAADINCDGARNVIDVQALILLALKLPYAVDTDFDGDHYLDSCDPDDDDDGDPDVTDCKPKDPAVHHGQDDVCNGLDDDCDGAVDNCHDGDPCTGPDVCLAGACTPGPDQCGAGDGCVASQVPGCGGCGCETCVCDADPFCCTVEWDSLCVKRCSTECGAGCDGGNGCIPSAAPGCLGCGCEGCVCEKNPYCCETAWDEQCTVSCAADCGYSCDPSDGCSPAGAPGCNGCGCESCVCDADSFCCDVAWDSNCAESCSADCGQACNRESGGLGCFEMAAPGCVGCACETCVCNNDPLCCSVAWDAGCVGLCEGSCGFSCDDVVAECGDGACQTTEDCDTCPADCGACCGNGACDFDETCATCAADCGPCDCSDGCTESLEGGCCGCACEGCVCALDAFCCDVLWDSSCTVTCGDDCGQACNGEKGGIGCLVSSMPGSGCGGCACETCVCNLDAACCDTMWDAACVSKCKDDCGFDCTGPITPLCGDGACNPGEECNALGDPVAGSCVADCPGCCGNGVCEDATEDCAQCPSDCGACVVSDGCTPSLVAGCDNCGCLSCVIEYPIGFSCINFAWDQACADLCTGPCGYTCDGASGGAGCFKNPDTGCGGCGCETCVCQWDPWCCEIAWDVQCVTRCQSEQCGYSCEGVTPVCGDGVCNLFEDCPSDCCGDGFCSPGESCLVDCCGNGECDYASGESCVSCGIDCGPCTLSHGCDESTVAASDGAYCESCVCGQDPTCCDVAWDLDCVALCGQCGMGCGAQSGGLGCFQNLKGPGCGGCGCEACVCAQNDYCCTTGWDEQCVQLCDATDCQFDCGSAQTECGDGICSTGEDCHNCFDDCGECCGDGTCGGDESCVTCGQDCGNCCGNGICDAGADTCGNCPEDCGDCCGNGVCDTAEGEMCGSCPADCGNCPGCSDGCTIGTITGEPNSGASCCGCQCEIALCGELVDGALNGPLPECCTTFWGPECVQGCKDVGQSCGGGQSDGCTASTTPGCAGCACEDCVCGPAGFNYTFCCDVMWDEICTYACQDCGTDCGL